MGKKLRRTYGTVAAVSALLTVGSMGKGIYDWRSGNEMIDQRQFLIDNSERPKKDTLQRLTDDSAEAISRGNKEMLGAFGFLVPYAVSMTLLGREIKNWATGKLQDY